MLLLPFAALGGVLALVLAFGHPADEYDRPVDQGRAEVTVRPTLVSVRTGAPPAPPPRVAEPTGRKEVQRGHPTPDRPPQGNDAPLPEPVPGRLPLPVDRQEPPPAVSVRPQPPAPAQPSVLTQPSKSTAPAETTDPTTPPTTTTPPPATDPPLSVEPSVPPAHVRR
ncbi:hypothetical protein ACQPZF_03950 [Actinosynnema sp. CS-041913]|uniref:hypothetical protein n=1 Tax=Actinosynnema sp. CS-041913 TaxID=3239917 RepID=UPI003D8AEFE0